MTSTIRSRSTISPMTIVVVREEPAGNSDVAPPDLVAGSAFGVVAGFGTSAVAGGGASVEGAAVDAAADGAVAASAGFGARRYSKVIDERGVIRAAAQVPE